MATPSRPARAAASAVERIRSGRTYTGPVALPLVHSPERSPSATCVSKTHESRMGSMGGLVSCAKRSLKWSSSRRGSRSSMAAGGVSSPIEPTAALPVPARAASSTSSSSRVIPKASCSRRRSVVVAGALAGAASRTTRRGGTGKRCVETSRCTASVSSTSPFFRLTTTVSPGPKSFCSSTGPRSTVPVSSLAASA